MDETPVWHDMVSNTTVDHRGAKSIRLKSTGHEKVMVTVSLAAKAGGTKLKPFIKFRGTKRESKLLDEEFKIRCVAASSHNAWMNEELTLVWVNRVLGSFSFNRQLLACDSFECDMMETVKNTIYKGPSHCARWLHKIHTRTGGLLEQAIQGFCRATVRRMDGSWSSTIYGGRQPPSKVDSVDSVDSRGLGKLSATLISNSFKSCGLRWFDLLFQGR